MMPAPGVFPSLDKESIAPGRPFGTVIVLVMTGVLFVFVPKGFF